MNSDIEDDEFLNDRYNVISHYRSKANMGVFFEKPVDIRPNPSEEDYERGYIERYFVQKKNSKYNLIHEVSGSQYQSLKMNPFYLCVSLFWELTGVQDKEKENLNEFTSVSDINEDEIEIAEKVIPGLGSKLKNKLEFYKKV